MRGSQGDQNPVPTNEVSIGRESSSKNARSISLCGCPAEGSSAGSAGEFHTQRVERTLSQRHWEKEGSPYKKRRSVVRQA